MNIEVHYVHSMPNFSCIKTYTRKSHRGMQVSNSSVNYDNFKHINIKFEYVLTWN